MEKKRYSEIRGTITSGDIVAWQGRYTHRNVLALLNQQVGHVGIAWVVSGRVFVIHALTKGIVINPLSRLTPFCWLATDAEWTDETQTFALSELGRGYSYVDVVRSVLGLNSIANNGWMCGEFARAVLQQANVPVTQDLPHALVKELQTLRPERALIKLT